jgi:hypothetical protein
VRIDVSSTQNQSASCAQRKWDYGPTPASPATPLRPRDLLDCQRMLSAVPGSIVPLNDGLRTLQFQSLSFNPANPTGDLLGGTQDNGTWSYTGSPSWLETVGGDGGQSGFNAGNPTIRFHNYFDATPEVNFHATDPRQWLDIYDPLQITSESRSFYIPFTTDPVTAGRAFAGLQHVWRTNDNGGNEAALAANGCYATNLNPFRISPCGDWVPIGQDLTSTTYGSDRAGQYVVAAVRAATDAGTMWAGTRTGRVFVTSNADDSAANVNFYRVDNPSTPGRFVSGIAIDPGNPDHAWISYSGYNAYTPTTPGHVFDVLYNPGAHSATFTDISNNLGDQPVTGIAEDRVTGIVFAATDFGVAQLAAGSNTWVQAGSGLPTSTVYGLTISHSARTLYAATHGRGAWALKLPPGPPNVPTGAIRGPATLELGQPATYTATGSSPNPGPVTFAWSLPGSSSSAAGTPGKFTPTKLGVQTVTLKVTDSTGASTLVTQAVTVKDKITP